MNDAFHIHNINFIMYFMRILHLYKFIKNALF